MAALADVSARRQARDRVPAMSDSATSPRPLLYARSPERREGGWRMAACRQPWPRSSVEDLWQRRVDQNKRMQLNPEATLAEPAVTLLERRRCNRPAHHCGRARGWCPWCHCDATLCSLRRGRRASSLHVEDVGQIGIATRRVWHTASQTLPCVAQDHVSPALEERNIIAPPGLHVQRPPA
jgi:hypothetical protein